MTEPHSKEEKREEEKSKDLFFKKLAGLSEDMIAAHGKEFSMGALVLAARFIADGKPFGQAPAAPTAQPANGAPRK